MTDHILSAAATPVDTGRRPRRQRFGTLAWAEARATWCGRWKWLWRGVGVLLAVLVALSPADWLQGPGLFGLLCVVSAAIPAWLGADLLSIRTRSNPEPLREWPPREFAARGVGRLLPFLLAETVWCGILVAKWLSHDLRHPSPAPIDVSYIHRWEQFPAVWLAWTSTFLVSGLTYAAWSALCSAVVRRPRRLAVTLLVVMIWTHLTLAVAAWAGGNGGSLLHHLGDPAQDVSAGIAPNVWLGVFSALLLLNHLPWLEPPDGWFFARICWAADVMWLLYALVPVPVASWITVRRFRRIPYPVQESKAEGLLP